MSSGDFNSVSDPGESGSLGFASTAADYNSGVYSPVNTPFMQDEIETRANRQRRGQVRGLV